MSVEILCLSSRRSFVERYHNTASSQGKNLLNKQKDISPKQHLNCLKEGGGEQRASRPQSFLLREGDEQLGANSAEHLNTKPQINQPSVTRIIIQLVGYSIIYSLQHTKIRSPSSSYFSPPQSEQGEAVGCLDGCQLLLWLLRRYNERGGI